jgi:hypothetical protein
VLDWILSFCSKMVDAFSLIIINRHSYLSTEARYIHVTPFLCSDDICANMFVKLIILNL